MDSDVIQRKIEEIRTGRQPRVLDLFAGCGGISLGFQFHGFNIVGGVEIDEHAARSHAINFLKGASESEVKVHSKARDITKEEPELLMKEYGFAEDVDSCVDFIVGGPPCQAFARVGRAKLREIASHPEAFLHDPRSNLYLRYIHYVKTLKPIALLIENVPDVLNYGGHNISEEICEVLEEAGYNCGYTLLNSVYYGVPQMRERMFLLGYRKELNAKVVFPDPTHWIELPRGYHGSRQVALKTINGNGNGSKGSQLSFLDEKTHFMSPPVADQKKVKPAIFAESAICDLPPITLHLEGKLKRGARRFDELIPYPTKKPKNPYQKLMRTWPGFENSEGIRDHVIRYLPRDYDIFRRMNPGDQYPEAYNHALDMLEERIAELGKQGLVIKKGSKEYDQLKKEIVPPYDPGKFPNKWRKMEKNQPARTLLAHLGKDGYSHIHYDSNQARTISVREAARFHSFPDGFVFSGTMNPAFRQIGNAVPPLMAAALAKTIQHTLTGK
ncbi:DNA cytosine methyltransferase [bacterium]|nr:DNA cytosine methyltransferase [bacterium]